MTNKNSLFFSFVIILSGVASTISFYAQTAPQNDFERLKFYLSSDDFEAAHRLSQSKLADKIVGGKCDSA